MKLKLTLLILTIQVVCYGQSDLKSTLDSVFLRTQQTSMYTSLVNWDSLQKQVKLMAENAKTIEDLKPAFTALLNGIKDKHGKIIDAKNYSPLAYFTDFENLNDPDKRIRDSETWKVVNDTALRFDYKILKGNIGYLKIVGIAPNVNIENESKKIRAAVVELSNKNIDKWIIDLRYNGGGNMHPMVTGIAPILGDGMVGSLTSLSGEKLFDWEIKNSNFIYAGYQAVNLHEPLNFKKQAKTAVLASRWTVSSGEILATCFKGRPNTKFFGEATGGYTTNNNWELINEDLILTISTGIFTDRNSISYQYNIPVDIEIPFEVVDDQEKDTCIIEAKKWLVEK